MLAIMNHLEPIEAGETQICSDGLRISSYTMEESGLPFVSDFSIRQALESKRAFDEMWVAINEPEPEPDPIEVKAFVPALPVAAPVAVPIQVKQPASSVPSGTADALEEHTAALIVVEVAEPHKQDDPVPYAEVSLVPEMAPCIALADAESGHSGSQKASEPVLDGLGVVGEGRDSAEIGQKPLENSGYFEPETAQATPYEEIPLLVPVQIRGTEDECTEYNARRARRDPWKHYPKPAASPKVSILTPAIGERPVQARSLRQAPLHKAVVIPAYVKAAKIAKQGNRCSYCTRSFGTPILHNGEIEILEPQPEHFRPRAAGGQTVDSNISYACHVCNGLKSDFLFETKEQAVTFLMNEWVRKGYTDCPLLVPFKRQPISYN